MTYIASVSPHPHLAVLLNGIILFHSHIIKWIRLQCFMLQQARNYIQSLPALKKKEFKDVFMGANPLGKFFSNKQLVWSWSP